MNKQKIIVISLMLVLTLSLLVGCSNSDQNNSASFPQINEANSSQQSETENNEKSKELVTQVFTITGFT